MMRAPREPAALFELAHVTRVLPLEVPVTLVRDINLVVNREEFVAISGPSGSGKSSLLYLMGLLDQPTEGSVFVEGNDTSSLDRGQLAALRLEKLGFVFQFHFLLEEFSVMHNVMIPMQKRGVLSSAERTARAQKLLNDLDLEQHSRKFPHQLSGGQRQRVAIARALANEPVAILADEPTGNLDTKNGQNVFDVFRSLVEEKNVTVITVTHDEHLASQTDRRIHLVDGKIVS